MNRLLKLLISLVYLPVAAVARLLRKATPAGRQGSCTILYYHEIKEKDRQRFARQMDLLARRARPVPADAAGPLLPGRYAAITFDDGFESVAEHALPELQRRAIPATIFIIPKKLGQYTNWEGYDGRLMDEQQVRGLPTDLISIGSHTSTHPNLTEVSESTAADELQSSKTELERLLNSPIKMFSFPYGSFNERLITTARNAGYERIFTTLPRSTSFKPGDHVFGRTTVEPTDWRLEFELKLLGGYDWLPVAIKTKRFLRSLLS